MRAVVPHHIEFAANEYHPTPQWLLVAHDVEKDAVRTFALSHIHGFWDAGVEVPTEPAPSTPVPTAPAAPTPTAAPAPVPAALTLSGPTAAPEDDDESCIVVDVSRRRRKYTSREVAVDVALLACKRPKRATPDAKRKQQVLR